MRIELIDQIQAPGTAKVKIGSTLIYITAPTSLVDNDIPNWAAVLNAISAAVGGVTPELIKIDAGTASPFSIDMTEGIRNLFGDRPTVLTDSAPGFPPGGFALQGYVDIVPYFVYTNSDFTGLVTVLINTHDASGNFDNDTYIWLKV